MALSWGKRWIDVHAPPCWGTEPVSKDGDLLGYVTSGGMGWRTGKMLAVAWIERRDITIGDELDIQILTHDYVATVVADPIYDPQNAKLLG